jgi:hypothetical protein
METTYLDSQEEPKRKMKKGDWALVIAVVLLVSFTVALFVTTGSRKATSSPPKAFAITWVVGDYFAIGRPEEGTYPSEEDIKVVLEKFEAEHGVQLTSLNSHTNSKNSYLEKIEITFIHNP